MYSEATVRRLLETAIDSLIDNFIREPYLHRVEHSMHCELYSMLNVHRSLQGTYPLADASRRTNLIHKEWPESMPRQEKNGRRGNFDLAILDPIKIAKCNIKEFATGRISPEFVVEMGLNYSLEHLMNDANKIKNSGLATNGYLVHLWQPHKGIRSGKLHDLESWCSVNSRNLAAAVFDRGRILRKYLHDNKLETV